MPGWLKRVKKLGEAWDWADRAWKVLGWLGLAQFILTALASWGIAVWATIEGVPRSTIAVMVLATFTMVLWCARTVSTMLVKPKAIRAPVEQAPFYEVWDDVDAFPLWQVAYLWINQEPRDPLPESGTKEFAVLEMLTRAAESGVLDVDLEGGYEWRNGTVSRANLIAYASRRERRPLFLFPDDRRHQWMAR